MNLPMIRGVAPYGEASSPVVCEQSCSQNVSLQFRTMGDSRQATAHTSVQIMHRFYTTILKKMTEYMKQNRSIDEANPWKESPFNKHHKLGGLPENVQEISLQNAQKIRSKLLRDNEIESDSAVVEGMATGVEAQPQEISYYRYAGPIADTAENIHWRTAYRIDLETAPEFKSDEWKEAASELSIPDGKYADLVIKKIRAAYNHLETVTQRNNGQRAVSTWELRQQGPALPDRKEERALRYLGQFPGIEPPAKDGPAWVSVEDS